MEVLNYNETARRIGICRSQLYALVRDKKFPQPVAQIPGAKRRGFMAHEVDGYLAERMAERDRALGVA